MQLLLQAGVTPGALKLGRQQYHLDGQVNAQPVLAIIEHAAAGTDTQQYGDILVGLLCQCCSQDGQNAGLVARALGLLAQAGVDFRRECWWPRHFGKHLAETWPDLCQAGVPVSPLVFACGIGSTGGVKGMMAALKQMDPQGWAQWVSAPAGPPRRCGLDCYADSWRLSDPERSAACKGHPASGAACAGAEMVELEWAPAKIPGGTSCIPIVNARSQHDHLLICALIGL